MQRTMLAAAAAVALLGSIPSSARAQADVALVYRLLQDGNMKVIRAGDPERWAQLGERLRHRDVVETSPNTRAALRFTDDASILRINAGSRVQLTTGDERGVVVRTLELELGEVWARVNRRQGAEFRIQTPAGVAAVKGTEFLVRVDSAGGVTVITLEGVVEFFNQAGRTEVSAGERTSAASQSEAPEAGAASPEELREAEAAGGEDGAAAAEGTWIEVQLQAPDGRMRTLMLQVPADALRGRVSGSP
jgi:ferric-dicitrate binding protein FerR (iron transport regulator)